MSDLDPVLCPNCHKPSLPHNPHCTSPTCSWIRCGSTYCDPRLQTVIPAKHGDPKPGRT